MTDAPRLEMARRLDAFVDAAFAFAVALLVAGGGDPPTTLAEMQGMLLSAPAYGASFALIIMFWLSYRDLGRLWPLRDALSTALSLGVVFVVLLYVFPLRLMMQSALHALSGGVLPGGDLINRIEDLRFLYVAYGAGCLSLSLLFAALYRHHLKQGAAGPIQAVSARIWIQNWVILSGASLASIIVALTASDAIAPWGGGLVYMSVPALIGIASVFHARALSRVAQVDTEAAAS
ncbi:TMEM175 family protein [Brevundimonas sp.]|uniref:TMEM175 family protein n=1 Tax=Brevundimonas sp. TaxID=1871086 RepID=UPI00286C029A|nr:TMEM175 family protein [Brevundimonas sp.]